MIRKSRFDLFLFLFLIVTIRQEDRRRRSDTNSTIGRDNRRRSRSRGSRVNASTSARHRQHKTSTRQCNRQNKNGTYKRSHDRSRLGIGSEEERTIHRRQFRRQGVLERLLHKVGLDRSTTEIPTSARAAVWQGSCQW
jgi:hypothetical protein